MGRMTLKLGILTPFLWSTPSAVNEQVRALAERLTAEGHQVTVIAPTADRTAVEEAHRRVQAVLTGEREGVFLPDEPFPRYFFAGATYAVKETRLAQAHRRAGRAHRQHRRAARRRGLRPAAPQRALRARSRLVGAALRRLPAGGHVPRQPGEDAAVLVAAAAAPAPVRLARRGHRHVRGRARPGGADLPRRVPGDPAGRRPRGVPPGLRAPGRAAAHRLQRRRGAAQGARRAAPGAAPARRRARRRRRRRLRRRPAGAPLRPSGAAGLGGPRALPRPAAARRGGAAAPRAETSSARRRSAPRRPASPCSRPWPPAPP